MPQEFRQPEDSGTPLRVQRMTADESRAVIDLWQQERVETTGLTDKPAVPDVAEGLDVSVEDVQRLLMEVRARRLEEEGRLAAAQELSEIRLAEEERKLAEIRRQRAELRREQAEAGRRDQLRSPQAVQVYEKHTVDPLGKTGAVIASLIFTLWVCFLLVVTLSPSSISGSGSSSGGCVLTLPDGTSQPCGPGFNQAHPELK